CGQSTHLPYSF
nr:immunoglobulin light chain junction region [Macaca mulatta]MOY12342.1 immunoglobulin light chain junction region [Macaca mulatta]MOY13917.1 immunoglobulin light chain junction region [Macaca mulatta]